MLTRKRKKGYTHFVVDAKLVFFFYYQGASPKSTKRAREIKKYIIKNKIKLNTL